MVVVVLEAIQVYQTGYLEIFIRPFVQIISTVAGRSNISCFPPQTLNSNSRLATGSV